MNCPICGSQECKDIHSEYRIQSWIRIEHKQKIWENIQKMKFIDEMEEKIKQNPVLDKE